MRRDPCGGSAPLRPDALMPCPRCSIVIIISAEVLGPNPGTTIGTPVQAEQGAALPSPVSGDGPKPTATFTTAAAAYMKQETAPMVVSPARPTTTTGRAGAQAEGKPHAPVGGMVGDAHGGPHGPIVPIMQLNPYQSRWTIRARVMNKSAMRQYQNAKGAGKLFSVDLLDESGEIRATAFNECADALYDKLETNRVYLISRGSLKGANHRFTALRHEYEITFSADTYVEPCPDDVSSMPQMKFNFVPIGELSKLTNNTIVDVIGVVKEAGEAVSLTSKGGKPLVKRDISLVDMSNKQVQLTLWGEQAQQFDGTRHPVLALKGARVTEFNGVALSTNFATVLLTEPDIKETYKLRGWFESVGTTAPMENLSTRVGRAFVDERKVIEQIASENLGAGEKPAWFSLKATVIFVKHDNFIYRACPSEGCKKRLSETSPNQFTCEKCNKQYSTFEYRLMLSLNVADHTGNQWLTAFHEQAEQILARSATELGAMKENGQERELEDIFAAVLFKTFLFRVRAKMDSYNGETRNRCTISSVQPVDPVKESHELIQLIARLAP